MDPTRGAHDAPADLLVGWGGGHQSQCPTPSAPRFPCLRYLILVPPVEFVPFADLELATVLYIPCYVIIAIIVVLSVLASC